MKLTEQGYLLRIFVGENDKYNNKPVYEEIVYKARELKMAGATVIKGIMGFGADAHLHSAKILRISDDLPIIIEIVDTEEKINQLLQYINDIVEEGLITLEKIKVIKYRCDKRN